MYVVQATLQSLLERLAVDHPHHSLYQLFALKNGNRGKDGKAAQAGDVVGGMAVTVDHDKVAAAQELISVVGANPARSACTHCCHSTSHHSRQGNHEDMSMCLDDIKSRVLVNGEGECHTSQLCTWAACCCTDLYSLTTFHSSSKCHKQGPPR